MAGVQVSHPSNYVVKKQGQAMREVVSDTFSSSESVAQQLQEGTRHSSAVESEV